MEERKRAFLVSMLGEERTSQIEEQLLELSKTLAEAGISFKAMLGGGAQTFAGADMETTMGVFGMLVSNIIHADLEPDERAEKLETLATDLVERLGVSDQEVKSFLARAVDAFSEDAAAGLDADKALDTLAAHVGAVIDNRGARRPAAAPMMLLMKSHGGYKRPLTLLWKALGLTGHAVAQEMRRRGGKGLGVTDIRLHQMLARGTKDDEARVLQAIEEAATRAGRTTEDFEALTDMLVGIKEVGSRGAINPHLRDLIVSKR